MIPADIITIQETVARVWGVPLHALLSRARPEPLASARLVAIALSGELTSHDALTIAGAFSRDQGHVYFSGKKCTDRQAADKVFASKYSHTRAECKAVLGSLGSKKEDL